MSSFHTKSAKELNSSMVKFHPELSSEYAHYPMNHKRWLQPSEKGPNGEPCYVKGGDPSLRKKDYVYCKRGAFGPGYYSLMTKTAYVNLYTKHDSMQPGTCGIACNAADRKLLDEHDDVNRLLHARQMSSKPQDAHAAGQALKEAQGRTEAAYAMDNPGEVLGTQGAKRIRL